MSSAPSTHSAKRRVQTTTKLAKVRADFAKLNTNLSCFGCVTPTRADSKIAEFAHLVSKAARASRARA